MEPGQEFEDVDLKGSSPISQEELIVRADEIDDGGSSISSLAQHESEDLESPIDPDLEDSGDGTGKLLGLPGAGTVRSSVRPILRRDAVAPPPPPPRQPPPPAPPAQTDDLPQPTDSLSLGQLKSLVANFPKLEPVAYAYTYEDSRTFPEELEEWFQYSQEDRDLIENSRSTFEKTFAASTLPKSTGEKATSWLALSDEERLRFIQKTTEDMESVNDMMCLEKLESLAHIAMGVWDETTSKRYEPSTTDEHEYEPPNQKYRKNIVQLEYIQNSASLICQAGILQTIFDVVRHICKNNTVNEPLAEQSSLKGKYQEAVSEHDVKSRQLNTALTIVYFVLESGRWLLKKKNDDLIQRSFVDLNPGILLYLSQIIAKIRWDEESSVPFTKMMLLLWKSTLLIFGDSTVLQECKSKVCKDDEKTDDSILRTSPLDYHIFRQEIISKYPAYNPPPPLIPLEVNNNSILPPHPSFDSSLHSQNSLNDLPDGNPHKTSIFHQPVHIATPAPSPPPSPAGPGGKGGKKQNYQTNQNFPFLYPPLDSNSNVLGGKGKTDLQDKLVGKPWEGGDVPASILEAGQLFASRMRMSRALHQLWSVREEFIRFERGWEEHPEHEVEDFRPIGETLETLDLSSCSSEEDFQETAERKRKKDKTKELHSDIDDPETRVRLTRVELYFNQILPQLQSIVIVLLKVLLTNVISANLASNNQNGAPAPTDIEDLQEDEKPLPKTNVNVAHQLTGVPNNSQSDADQSDQSLEDLNALRTREVTSKAITGFILSVLKWFRLSHILKFEYTTQLLLDSNYIPLALKYAVLQDIDKAVDLKHDRIELDFFHLCHHLTGYPQDSGASLSQTRPASSSSADSAAPPPIARHRPSAPSSTSSSPPPSPGSPGSPPRKPEVDELGYPTTTLPNQPLTTYAPRFFFTYITILRILQKLTKGHAHRALLLVQYKSSTILRRALKVPQPSLRLYTLKLFKTQVPFCGRKWRQANMRVITAVYVFCRMGLRDDWISGSGPIEELVEGAVGLERAWRGLVGWWLARCYRGVVPGTAGDEDGRGVNYGGMTGANGGDGFFARELEKMGWGVGGDALEDEFDEWGEWENGPLELDGW